MKSKLFLLMFYILTLTHGQEVDVPKFLHNFCLSKTGYMSISVIGVYGCARHCGMDSGCKSFTYNTEHHRCLLNEDNANTAPGQFNACPGYIYGERTMVISEVSLMGSCSDHDCPAYTTCVHLYSSHRVCIVSACGPLAGDPVSVSTDDLSTTMITVGVSRDIECDTGYIGYRTVVCLASGLWSELEVDCTDCGNPPSVDNAIVSNGDTTIGSNRVYTCLPATTASGSGAITCRQDGTWSMSSLVCIPDCSVVTNMNNAHTGAIVAPAGSTISYICDPGYFWLYGTGNRYCNSAGEWETLDLICVCYGQPSIY